MAKKEKKKLLILAPNKELLRKVRHAFENQETTFTSYCESTNKDRRNATRAILGTDTFPKAIILKQMILADAKLTETEETTTQPTQDTSHDN